MKPHFVKDPASWLCFSVLVGIWLYNSMVIPKLVLLPHYHEGHLPGAVVVGYFIASALCVAALVRASTADPGRPPVDPHIPPSEQQHWTLCRKCEAMRPKRSHHCRRCGHCVRRMDHHCPWINNCVGEDNHWLFLQLCLYALVLSLFTLLLVVCHSFYFQPVASSDQETFTGRHEVGLLRASGLMSVLMLAGISVLSWIQMSGILSDTTMIERAAQLPGDGSVTRRSWQFALSEVCGTRWKVLWLVPLRHRRTLQARRDYFTIV